MTGWYSTVCPFLIAASSETGLSQADILPLTNSMIREEEGIIKLTDGRKKTGADQTCPLTETAWTVIAEAHEERKNRKVQPCEYRDLLFVRPDDGYEPGKPVSKSMIARALKRACTAVGIGGFRFHDFRHCVATRWHKQKVPPKVAMLGMGWKSAAMMVRHVNIHDHDIAEQFGTAKSSCNIIVKKRKGARSSARNY